jgi:hypothetical protein
MSTSSAPSGPSSRDESSWREILDYLSLQRSRSVCLCYEMGRSLVSAREYSGPAAIPVGAIAKGENC